MMDQGQLNDSFDVDHYRMPKAECARVKALAKGPQRKPPVAKGMFFKGLPWELFTRAAQLPGKSLHVYLAVWHIANLENQGSVKWRPSVVRRCGLKRGAVYRALGVLEAAGLIVVEGRPGSSPTITLLDADDAIELNLDRTVKEKRVLPVLAAVAAKAGINVVGDGSHLPDGA